MIMISFQTNAAFETTGYTIITQSTDLTLQNHCAKCNLAQKTPSVTHFEGEEKDKKLLLLNTPTDT